MAFFSRHQLHILVIITLFLTFFGVWRTPVTFSDEILIEGTSWETAQTHSWLIPRINDGPDFIRPPLLTWLTAPLYLIFPPGPITVRAWMILFGVSLILVTYRLAKFWFDDKVAFWSGIFLVTSTGYLFFSHTANIDLPNAFFMTISLYLYNLGKKRPVYLYFAGITLAFGLLTRSFLAIAPFGVIIADWIIFGKKTISLRTILITLIVALVITLPWYTSAYLAYPREFLFHTVTNVFTNHAFGMFVWDKPTTPLFYTSLFVYVPSMIFIVLWLCFKLFRTWHNKHLGRLTITSRWLQLILWIVFYLLPLLFSQNRQVWYAVPLYPPFAILSGYAFLELYSASSRQTIVKNILIIMLAAVTLGSVMRYMLIPFSESDLIRNLRELSALVPSSQPLYTTNPSLPITKLFPKRRIIYVGGDELQNLKSESQGYFMLHSARDTQKACSGTVIYSEDDFILLNCSQGSIR